MKSLKTIQTIAKVLKVLYTIGMVCAYIGAVGCLVGGSILLWTDSSLFRIGVFEGYWAAGALGGLSRSLQMFADMVVALGSALVCTATVRYLKHELDAGTPFTQSGAQELRTLGIKTIVYPLVALILAAILCACGQVEKTYSNVLSVGLGVALILLSFVFRYGADLEQQLSPGKTL